MTPSVIALPSMADELSSCEAQAHAQAELTADEKAQLDRLCRAALASGSSNSPAALAAKREICLTIVRDSGVTGPAAAAARQSCREGAGVAAGGGPTGATGATGPAAAAEGLLGFGSSGG